MNTKTRWLTFSTTLLVAAFSLVVIADDSGSDKSVEQPAVVQTDEESEVEEAYQPKTKLELRKSLSPIQYDVTQNEATEQAFRNKFWNNKSEGIYKCIVCDRELFSSETKYKSGTGWPSFFAPLDEKNVGYRTDWKLFYARTEVHCSRCKAHLGHVFDDGPKPTGKRYCMNSAAMTFEEKSDAKKTPRRASSANE